ncbi:MAG TPA: type II secretion system protein [Candidatus Udaeobacter sp.]
MTYIEKIPAGGDPHSDFVIDSSFACHALARRRRVIRHSSFIARSAFTLIELVVVFALILVLTGLVLSTAGYARKQGARARAQTEIAAMSAACESYKSDNGVYPRGPASAITISTVTIPANVTDSLDARTKGDPTSNTDPTYGETSLYLYTLLSGDSNGSRNPGGKSYMQFKPNMLLPAGGTGTVTAIADPFGNSYGYSTANQADPITPKGYNPTFDLWSTAGLTANPPPSGTDTITPQWIKNW